MQNKALVVNLAESLVKKEDEKPAENKCSKQHWNILLSPDVASLLEQTTYNKVKYFRKLVTDLNLYLSI